jgi:prepilin-type N-terminal cleavage/methylation domain-containing protein
MRRRLRRLHSDESGFTLPELLTAIVIGLVVLMAAFMLLDRTVASTARISDRQEAVQRGRLTMELMTRQLRSQVCLADDTPILAGDDNSVTFYANLSSNPNTAQKRALRYVASEKRIYEDVYNGTGTYPALTFPSSPTTSKELLRPVAQANEKVGSTMVARPIFRYYRYKTPTPPATPKGDLEQLTTPLTATTASQVVVINIAFATLPIRKVERTTDVKDATTFASDVYVRLADPTKPTEGPACL